MILATLRANIAATIFGAASAILLCICVYQNVRINGFLWIDGLEDEIADCARDRNELRAIAKEKNEQKAETEKRVEQADKSDRQAREIADKIRSAPIPQNCETPGLELLRNEI